MTFLTGKKKEIPEVQVKGIYYLQYDGRHSGFSEWEEVVVHANNIEEAKRLALLEDYPDNQVCCEIIGWALDDTPRVICHGFHDNLLSFQALKEEIRYVVPDTNIPSETNGVEQQDV